MAKNSNLIKLHKKAKTKGKIDIADKKVTTSTFIISYPALFKAREYKGKKSWGCTMLFSKDKDLSALEIAAQNACIEKWGADPSRWPTKKKKSKKTGKVINVSTLANPFRDGDLEKPDKPEYENMIFINTSRKKDAPGVCNYLGPGVKPEAIEDENEVRAGDICRATLIANAFDEEGSCGVSFSLQNVQKIQTGKRIGGGRSAEQDFTDDEEFEIEEYETEDEDYSGDDESDDEDDSEDDD